MTFLPNLLTLSDNLDTPSFIYSGEHNTSIGQSITILPDDNIPNDNDDNDDDDAIALLLLLSLSPSNSGDDMVHVQRYNLGPI